MPGSTFRRSLSREPMILVLRRSGASIPGLPWVPEREKSFPVVEDADAAVVCACIESRERGWASSGGSQRSAVPVPSEMVQQRPSESANRTDTATIEQSSLNSSWNKNESLAACSLSILEFSLRSPLVHAITDVVQPPPLKNQHPWEPPSNARPPAGGKASDVSAVIKTH